MARNVRGMSRSVLRDQVAKCWQQGAVPDVYELSRIYPPANSQDLADAVKLDMSEAWKHQQPRAVADYFRRLPPLTTDEQLQVELIEHDFRLRCEHSQTPDIDSYVMQFPALQQILKGRLIGDPDLSQSLETTVQTPEALGRQHEESVRTGILAVAGMPETIGRYVVHCELGSGQFGKVYRAFDDRLHRVVAIKVPKRSGLSEAELQAFQTEARNLAQLQHPHVVSIYDFGLTDDGGCYVVGQFIDGTSLLDAMARRSFSCEEAAILLAMVSDGLQAAHDRGIVHRDVKPANILLDTEGRPYVADFGLAATAAQRMVSGGEIAGSPAYMSPEQARGETLTLDGRSDVWAVGIILYELLTGRRPFTGGLSAVLQQVTTTEPPAPSSVSDGIPPMLETICLKCLQKDPRMRFQTAAELAAELRSFLTPASAGTADTFRVISTTWLEDQPFPVLGCTVMNRSREAIVLTAVRVNVSEFRSFRSGGASRQLEPVAWVDACLPTECGRVDMPLAAPILIASQDAATIAVRCSCRDETGNSRPPAVVGGFRFSVTFLTDLQTSATTDEIKLGRL